MKNKAKAILRIALVALFVSYYAGATLFPHTHTYTWGQVTHSHPYLPSSQHAHSVSSLQAIESLSSLLFIVCVTIALPVFAKLLGSIATPVHELHLQLFIPYSLLRAPPAA